MRFALIWGPKDSQYIEKELVVGRRDGDLTFAGDDIMSGAHARFSIKDGQLQIMDLGSSNGTRVNRRRIQPHVAVVLNHHDEIKMGSHIFRVICEDEPQYEQTRLEHISPEGTVIERNEGTFVEISLDAAPAHTPAPRTPSEGTASEASVAQAAAAEAPVAKAVTESAPAPSEYSITTLPPANSIVSISAEDVPVPRRRPRMAPIIAPEEETPTMRGRAQAKLQWLWTQKPLLGAALILTLFAIFHLTRSRPVTDVVATRPRRAPVKHAAVEPKVIVEEIKPLLVARAPDSQTPLPRYTGSEATLVSPATDEPTEVAPPTMTEVAETTEPPAPPRPRKVKKAAVKTTQNKNDRFSEAALFATLKNLSLDYKRTQSSRVRAAIETDAIELSSQHYHGLRLQIKAKWENGRSLASVSKSKLKETLARSLVEINNREKAVRARVLEFVTGRRASPFP